MCVGASLYSFCKRHAGVRAVILTQAADVYAFGVLLWEMLSGERAWANLTAPQIMVAVTCQNKTLEFPSWTMHDIARSARPHA